MESISNAVGLFDEKTFTIPMGPMLFIFGICLWCLVYGRYKTGLIVAYFFIFYWGFLSDRLYWITLFGENSIGHVFYIFSALGIALMGLLGLVQEGRH